MIRRSAGLILFRESPKVEFLLVHMGGPFWARKDLGSWSIPKGEFSEDEDPLNAARREFEEEMGSSVTGEFIALEPIKQAGGKVVHAWAVRSDFNGASLRSHTFEMEWPPRSGRVQKFPEVDRAEWFSEEIARRKILKGQVGFIDQVMDLFRVS